ncbi:DnaJ sub B member 9 [Homalodisca vitripennis]|nr:DnaJ sub B member 9 [Homalodisca vitripennis]
MQLWQVMWLLTAVLLASVELTMQSKRDYYEILGIDRDAKPKEIKKAFRTMAAKYHPDKNKDPDAEEKFKEINEAHEVLMNADKRRQYDMYGHSDEMRTGGPTHGSGSGFTFHFDSHDDVLRSFFGQDFAGERPPPFHFSQGGGRHSHHQHQHQNFFSFNDFFEDDEPGFGEFFGDRDPHQFGSGSSFFGTHFGGGRPQPQQHHAHWGHSHGHAHARAQGTRCRTVTQRVGNMVTTYTQCS